MKQIRYSLISSALPTTPDSPDVRYGPPADAATPGIRLLPPCAPTKIVCVGRNYLEHARELGNEAPSEPLLFLKPPSSLIASGDAIVYPSLSQRVDFEGELGIVIGDRARNVPREEALDYVLGFTIVNDVTARDLQKKDGQWTRGKGFDTFCAVGPCLVSKDELDFASLRVRTLVDGEVKQDGSILDMIFPLDVIIAYITSFMTLEPGDLIATGTPPGVGPLTPGSIVRVEIDGIGVLENSVISEGAK
ncbi:MAG: fumarylacetoacetate hydrolase family protein [Bryobacteraceae bacterium]|jgi:2-keto-4-pentenoate hydratase/2-oxohepta-3-ene-1,7-dioic acid hydratase in catechol pathway